MPTKIHGLPRPEIEVEYMLPQDRSLFMKSALNDSIEAIKKQLWCMLVSQGLELSGCPADYVFSYSNELSMYEIVDETVILCSLDIYHRWNADPGIMKWLELRPRNRILSRKEKDMLSMVQALTNVTLSELGAETNLEVECARRNFAKIRHGVEKIRDNYEYYYGARTVPKPLPTHLQKRCREQLLFVQFFFPTGSTKSHLNELHDKTADMVRDEMFPKDPVKKTLYGLPEDAVSSDYVLKVAGLTDYISGDIIFTDFCHIRYCLVHKEHIDLLFVGRPAAPGDDEPLIDTSLLDPEDRYKWVQSELSLDGKSHTNINALSLWDVNQKLRIRMVSCEGIADTEEGLSSVYIQCTLHHGQNPLSAPGSTKHVDYSATPSWFQWLTYDISLKNIPQDTRLHIVIRAVTKGRKKSVSEVEKPKASKKSSIPIGKTEPKAEPAPPPVGEDIGIAWINLSMVDFRSRLRTGSMLLHCWNIFEDNENGVNPIPEGVVSENGNPSAITLKIAFDDYMYPVVVPAYPEPLESTDNGPIPSASEQSRLEALMYNVDALSSLSDKEKEMIWKYRRFLLHYDQALPKVLQSVDWCHQEHVEEVVRMLDLWAKPRMEIILELLSCRSPCRPVRAYAVGCLEECSNATIHKYMLQLVEALKYETYHDSCLARFLLKRSLLNRELGHYFFWHLRGSIHSLEMRVRLGLVLEAYVRGCGDEQRLKLLAQVRACTILRNVAKQLKSEKYQNEAQRKAYLLEALQASDFPENFSPVFNPYMTLGKIIAKDCTFFDSKKKPLLLTFENGDSHNGNNVQVSHKSAYLYY